MFTSLIKDYTISLQIKEKINYTLALNTIYCRNIVFNKPKYVFYFLKYHNRNV